MTNRFFLVSLADQRTKWIQVGSLKVEETGKPQKIAEIWIRCSVDTIQFAMTSRVLTEESLEFLFVFRRVISEIDEL